MSYGNLYSSKIKRNTFTITCCTAKEAKIETSRFPCTSCIWICFSPPADEVSACPGNQVFLYNLTMCQQTCRSIADGEKYCLQDFAPVDGCGCPDNTYLDNQDTCVPISKCPCYYKGSYLEPGEYVTKDGERWYVLLHRPVCWDKNLF